MGFFGKIFGTQKKEEEKKAPAAPVAEAGKGGVSVQETPAPQEETGVLVRKNIILNNPSVDKESAIRAIGQILVDGGYVTEKYVDGMIAKEEVFNTGIGNFLAIPHGIESVIGEIKKPGIAIMTYPEGIDWGEEGGTVKLVVAIASAGDEHVDALAKVAMACESEEAVEKIIRLSVDEIYDMFA